MAGTCIIPKPWGRLPGGPSAPRYDPKGYFLGSALVKAAADRRAATAPGVDVGRLGKSLCGFDDSFHPARPEPEPVGPVIACSTAQESGGVGGGTFTVTLGTDIGTVTLDYEAYGIPDGFTVNWNGVDVIATGSVSGSGSPTFYKSTAYPTTATVTVEAPDEGTAWVFSLSCPA